MNDSLQTRPISLSTNEPFSFFSQLPQQADQDDPAGSRPPGADQPDWYHEIWDILSDNGAVEMEEEGPVI